MFRPPGRGRVADPTQSKREPHAEAPRGHAPLHRVSQGLPPTRRAARAQPRTHQPTGEGGTDPTALRPRIAA